MAALSASVNFVVPETPPCSQAAAQTPLTLLSQTARCSQSDISPLRLPALGDASCIGDTLRIEDDSCAAGDSSSEGEDIMHSAVLRKDYQSMPHLDSYSSLAVDDSVSLPNLSEQQVSPRPQAPVCCIRSPSLHILVTPCQRRAAEAEMERRDRVAQLRQQSASSTVPRAIGGAVDERDIIEMMERRSMAETAAAADDDKHEKTANEDGSTGIEVVNLAIDSPGVVEEADAAAAVGHDAGPPHSSASEASFSGSEEESGGSWSGEDGEDGEEDDSDIEEFYLKGGEGQMDEVEKKKKAAAEQKLVMVPARALTFSCTLTFSPRCNLKKSDR
jgi:hypothetical protein